VTAQAGTIPDSLALPIKFQALVGPIAQRLHRTTRTLAVVEHVLELGSMANGARVRTSVFLPVVCLQGDGAIGGVVSQDLAVLRHGQRPTTPAVEIMFRVGAVGGLVKVRAHVADLDAVVPELDAHPVAGKDAVGFVRVRGDAAHRRAAGRSGGLWGAVG
jgi:hypothetical protein